MSDNQSKTEPSEIADPYNFVFEDGDIVLTCLLRSWLNRLIHNWSGPFVHAGVYVSAESFSRAMAAHGQSNIAKESAKWTKGVLIEVRHGGPTFVPLEDFIGPALAGKKGAEGIGVVRVAQNDVRGKAATWACERLAEREEHSIREASQYAYGDLAIAAFLAFRLNHRVGDFDAVAGNDAANDEEAKGWLAAIMREATPGSTATHEAHPFPGRWTCCSFAYEAYEATHPGSLVLGFRRGTRFAEMQVGTGKEPAAYIQWPGDEAHPEPPDTDNGNADSHLASDYVKAEALALSDLTGIGMTDVEASALIGALNDPVTPENQGEDPFRHELFEQRRRRDLPDLAPTRLLGQSSAAIRVLARLGSHGFRLLRAGVEPVPLSRTMTSSDIWNATSDVKRFFAGIEPPPAVDVEAISYQHPKGSGGEPR